MRRKQDNKALFFWCCFALIFFATLYFRLDATLSLTQLRLSEGLTVYQPWAGALIFTVLLLALQRIVARISRFPSSLSLLTYFPSAALLIVMSSFVDKPARAPLIVTSVLSLAWLCFFFFTLRRPDTGMSQRPRRTDWFCDIVCFFLTVFYIGAMCDANDVRNYEVRVARLINEKAYGAALKVGDRSLAESQYLTALRSFAAAHSEEGLGNRLFRFPLPADASARTLLLLRADSIRILFRPDSLFAELALLPYDGNTSPIKYLAQSSRLDSSRVARDYYLCALLLNRDLETFASECPRFYRVPDSLPRHYAEALILYDRFHPEYELKGLDSHIVANYWDFKEKEKSISSPVARRNLLRREFGNTYWWYYFYNKVAGKLSE